VRDTIIGRGLPSAASTPATPCGTGFATLAYSADRDLLAVQQLLGHAEPEIAERYAALPAGALERAVLAAG
jgi:hypothetical protein